MKIVAKTDKGIVRETNQDSYAVGEMPNEVAWAVVCDGMGGAAGGNVASASAVKMISEQLTTQYRDGMGAEAIQEMLMNAIQTANTNIYEMSVANESLKGMGTTVVTVIITKNQVYIAHAGDSRAYRIQPEGIRQITRDHSMVQDMVEKGEITPDEAKAHPKKNIITRALGVDVTLQIDYGEEPLSSQDIILICTDGLSNHVDPEEIYTCTREGDYYKYADRLVNLANQKGGTDNITVVAIAQ